MAKNRGITDGLDGDERFRPPADEDSIVPAGLPHKFSRRRFVEKTDARSISDRCVRRVSSSACQYEQNGNLPSLLSDLRAAAPSPCLVEERQNQHRSNKLDHQLGTEAIA